MKIALVIGHSEKKQGAVDPRTGITEYQFNNSIAPRIAEQIPEVELVYRTTSYSKLPKEINAGNYDLVISMHCNAFNGLKKRW